MIQDLLSLTRRSGIEEGGGDVVGGQGKVQGVQPSRPRSEADVAGLGVEGVVGHVQQATTFHSDLLRQCNLQRQFSSFFVFLLSTEL